MGTFPPTEVQYIYSSLLSHVTPTVGSSKFYSPLEVSADYIMSHCFYNGMF